MDFTDGNILLDLLLASLLNLRHKAPLLLSLHRGLPRSLPGPRVRSRSLTSHRQALSVPQTPVAPDIHEALDVYVHLFAKIAFDLVLLFNDVPDLRNLFLAEHIRPLIRVNACPREYLVRHRSPDPVEIGQRDLDPLLSGDVNTGNSCHASPPYPCFCLCLGFSHMTLTIPFRLMILHLSHLFPTEGRTFITNPPSKLADPGEARSESWYLLLSCLSS